MATNMGWTKKLVLLLLVFVQLFTLSQTSESVTKSKKRSLLDDNVRVLFCTSCGFRQNFMQLKGVLEEKYPHLTDHIYGETYPPGAMQLLASKLLGYAQLGGIVLMIFGETLFASMGWDQTMLKKMLENKITCFAMIMLMGTLSQSLVSTGAFEIYFNDELIFSRIQQGRWPTAQEIIELLEAKGISELL